MKMPSAQQHGSQSTNAGSGSRRRPLVLFIALFVAMLSFFLIVGTGGGGGGSAATARTVLDAPPQEANSRGNDDGVAPGNSVGSAKLRGDGGAPPGTVPSLKAAEAKASPPPPADGEERGDGGSSASEGEKRRSDKAVAAPSGAAGDAAIPPQCLTSPLLHFPLSPIEHELRRLLALTALVMKDMEATYWPADASLLGAMRSGRVATDRDLDFSLHATFGTCHTVLGGLKKAFERRGAKVKYFKVANVKAALPEGAVFNGHTTTAADVAASKKTKIGRYGMVRIIREHGDFDTGVDFNCVYMDDPRGPSFFTHKGVLTVLPKSTTTTPRKGKGSGGDGGGDGSSSSSSSYFAPAIYPLGRCLLYNTSVPCPANGMAFLDVLTPRYDGCMVFPHCIGEDPSKSHRDCLTPHPKTPLPDFLAATRLIKSCGFVSLADHYEEEPRCAAVLAEGFTPRCDASRGLCFIQSFKD